MEQRLDLSCELLAPVFDFLREVEERSGQPIRRCYQCLKCTAGCPMNFAMDIQPSGIVRLVQFGQREQLLGSEAIWQCTGCMTCKSRCPNGIGVGEINDILKAMAVASGRQVGDSRILAFHRAFLDSVARTGRVHELSMMLRYKLGSRTYTQDIWLGMRMFRRGLFRILPEGVRRKREIKEIFGRSRRGG
jgi:heterodisulfide reductase subunit C